MLGPDEGLLIQCHHSPGVPSLQNVVWLEEWTLVSAILLHGLENVRSSLKDTM